MANFDETRFLGLTPRAIGLSVVAVTIVVGLFFIPEAVKFLFDAKPRSAREQGATTATSTAPKQAAARKSSDGGSSSGGGGDRAALSRPGLGAISAEVTSNKRAQEQTSEPVRIAKRSVEGPEPTSRKGGILSGWDFSIRAHPSGGSKVEAPPSLSFEKIVSREGVNFLKQGRGAIPRFLKQEAILRSSADDAVEELTRELDTIISGDTKEASSQEVANRLRAAHVAALRGLRAAGADRGVLLRWLELPVIRFIDDQGEVKAARKIRESFNPGLILMDLVVKQRPRRGFGVNGRIPTSFQAELSVAGTDVQKVVAYSNGKMVRSIRLSRAQLGEHSLIKMQGDATAVWTFVAYDSFGARPYSKSYSFYPKAGVFRQESDGTFQIGFLPGSGRHSLDRFFLVGTSGRRRLSDSIISTF